MSTKPATVREGGSVAEQTASAALKHTAFHLKKLLVPIDFSDCSKKALQYAIPLAREYGSEILLLHVVPINYASSEFTSAGYTSIESGMREVGEEKLSQLISSELRETVTIESAVHIGMPAPEIIETARKLPADLIIISTHGHTGLKHVLLGSVAEHVVRQAPCPVLVVREREHEFLNS